MTRHPELEEHRLLEQQKVLVGKGYQIVANQKVAVLEGVWLLGLVGKGYQKVANQKMAVLEGVHWLLGLCWWGCATSSLCRHLHTPY